MEKYFLFVSIGNSIWWITLLIVAPQVLGCSNLTTDIFLFGWFRMKYVLKRLKIVRLKYFELIYSSILAAAKIYMPLSIYFDFI